MDAVIQNVTYEPITIRLPQQGKRCPWTGLTRSALNDLVLPTKGNDFSPPVKSNLLKTKVGSSGIRLNLLRALGMFAYTSARSSHKKDAKIFSFDIYRAIFVKIIEENPFNTLASQ